MNLNFAAALATLGANAAFRFSRAARAAADYLFNTVLPDREQFTYAVEGGSMTVRPTMPGLVGMDSPYPPMGTSEVSTFLEQSAKLAGEVPMTEQALRHLQDMLFRLNAAGGVNTNERLVEEVFNFLDAVIVQPHLDIREWLKGQALVHGQINWTFNNKNLLVDYGIPAANRFAARTGVDGYGGTASKFWVDVRRLRQALRRYAEVRILSHPDTIDMARYNPANGMATIAEGDGGLTFRRFARDANGAPLGGNFSADTADVVQVISYGLEGEIINPANPRTTLVMPFLSRGKLLGVGIGRRRAGYVVGQGAVADDPRAGIALGYGHVAPTVEGNGQPGLWSDLYTPEKQPWQLIGRAAQNFLPVIEDNEGVAVATTDMV